MAAASSASAHPVPSFKSHFQAIRMINEAGTKLEVSASTVATAICLYHSFYEKYSAQDYDAYMIAATCTYISCKQQEEHSVKVRDIVNVFYRIIHSKRPPLELDDKFYLLRDSVTNTELFVLRAVKFNTRFELPHRYMVHYLKSMHDWLTPVFNSEPVVRTSWSQLRDSYFDRELALHTKPQHLAIACIYLALQCYGMVVPGTGQWLERPADVPWFKVFAEDIDEPMIQGICQKLFNAYALECQATAPT